MYDLIDELIYLFLKNGLFHQSIYKYNNFSTILTKKYPYKSDYELRKYMNFLIKKGYVLQIFNGVSYEYQFINKDSLKIKKYELEQKKKLINADTINYD